MGGAWVSKINEGKVHGVFWGLKKALAMYDAVRWFPRTMSYKAMWFLGIKKISSLDSWGILGAIKRSFVLHMGAAWVSNMPVKDAMWCLGLEFNNRKSHGGVWEMENKTNGNVWLVSRRPEMVSPLRYKNGIRICDGAFGGLKTCNHKTMRCFLSLKSQCRLQNVVPWYQTHS